MLMNEKLELWKKIAFGPMALAAGITVVAFITGENSAKGVFGVSVFITLLWMPYLLPSYIAAKKDHQNFNGILLVNILTGMSVIGFVAALIWAFNDSKENTKSESNTGTTIADDTKKCPFCAEDIKIQATKCKHCGSVLVS